jgi:hypothetical protein
MSTTTVYSGAADGQVWCVSTTYLTARSGSGALDDNPIAGTAYSGQYYSSPNYTVMEGFLNFDIKDIPDGDQVTDVVLTMWAADSNHGSQDFVAQARLYDWGAGVTTSDWIPGANFSALKLLATVDSAGIALGSPLANNTSWVSETGASGFAAEANLSKYKDGSNLLSISLGSDRVNAASVPVGNEFIGWYTSEYSGTDHDPKLVVTHAAPVVAPTVTTAAISAITTTGAISGGTVTADGGATVTDAGICWNTAGTPTIADSHVHHASPAVETFAENLTGLVPGTTYHVRAWGENSVGPGYGGEVDFMTHSGKVSPIGSAIIKGLGAQ